MSEQTKQKPAPAPSVPNHRTHPEEFLMAHGWTRDDMGGWHDPEFVQGKPELVKRGELFNRRTNKMEPLMQWNTPARDWPHPLLTAVSMQLDRDKKAAAA